MKTSKYLYGREKCWGNWEYNKAIKYKIFLAKRLVKIELSKPMMEWDRKKIGDWTHAIDFNSMLLNE